jgi:hypothetical protein
VVLAPRNISTKESINGAPAKLPSCNPETPGRGFTLLPPLCEMLTRRIGAVLSSAVQSSVAYKATLQLCNPASADATMVSSTTASSMKQSMKRMRRNGMSCGASGWSETGYSGISNGYVHIIPS